MNLLPAPACGSPPSALTCPGPQRASLRFRAAEMGEGRQVVRARGTRWAGSLCAHEPPRSELPTSSSTREAAGHCPAASASGYHFTDGQSRGVGEGGNVRHSNSAYEEEPDEHALALLCYILQGDTGLPPTQGFLKNLVEGTQWRSKMLSPIRSLSGDESPRTLRTQILMSQLHSAASQGIRTECVQKAFP